MATMDDFFGEADRTITDAQGQSIKCNYDIEI